MLIDTCFVISCNAIVKPQPLQLRYKMLSEKMGTISNNTESRMKRNTTIEILRFLFIYLIVVTHVFIHGNNLEYSSVYTLGANLLTSFHFEVVMLGKIGVIGFVFISGYYGIKLNIGKPSFLYLLFSSSTCLNPSFITSLSNGSSSFVLCEQSPSKAKYKFSDLFAK